MTARAFVMTAFAAVVASTTIAPADSGGFVLDPDTGKLHMRSTVDIPGRSAPDLYALASNWVVESFRDAGEVTQQADPERGRIVARGWWTGMTFGLLVPQVWFDTIIEVKDGRYRVTFTAVHLEGYLDGQRYDVPLENSQLYTKTGTKQLNRRASFERQFHDLAASLRAVMDRTETATDADW